MNNSGQVYCFPAFSQFNFSKRLKSTFPPFKVEINKRLAQDVFCFHANMDSQ